MGASRVTRAGTPYNGVELADLDFVQTTDTIYLAHIDHAPGKLVRDSDTSWVFSTLAFGPTLAAPATCTVAVTNPNQDQSNNGQNFFPLPATYCVTAVDDTVGQESRASPTFGATNDLTLKNNVNTVGWNTVPGATRYNVYRADNTQFFGYIGTTQATTFTDDNIGPELDLAPPAGWNPFVAAADWPSTVNLFQDRSVWARSTNTPHGIWTSRSGELENMDRSLPLRPDDSMAFAIVAGAVNSVNQLATTTSLIALTSNNVFTVTGNNGSGALDATGSPVIQRQIGRGSSRIKPIVVDNVVFHAPSVGNSVRAIGYDFTINGLKSNDLTIFSPHLFLGHTIVSWCYAQEPRSLIWAARDDGALLCFTWEQEQNVWGWTLCDTDGQVLSLCSVPENGEDRVYMIVQRTVNGTPRRFVEQMAPQLWTDVAATCFVDCAVSATFATPQASFTGLWHLEGRSDVAGLVDGAAVGGLSVTDGTLTLPPEIGTGSVVTFGIPYTAEVATLPLRMNVMGQGSTIGRVQNAAEVVLTLEDTRGICVGVDAAHLHPVKERTNEAWDSPDRLMNGDYLINLDNRSGNSCSVLIRQTAALPFTLLGVATDPVFGG